MRILFVAMAGSIHTARWISQLSGLGWDLHLFPCGNTGIEVHPEIREITLHHAGCLRHGSHGNAVRMKGVSPFRRIADIVRDRVFTSPADFDPQARRLASVVRSVRPDLVHSLEFQHAGYLVAAAKARMSGEFPPWLATNWGSDIYLFGRLAEHDPKIRRLLATCDYYSCECRRDVALARAFGFRGKVLPVVPNSGGFDLDAVFALRKPGPVSGRRLILLKGYHGWAGRALVGLRALERCAELLAGYEVAIYSAGPEVLLAAELFSRSTGVPVRIVPEGTPHREMLALHGCARVSIGLGISDAISTSLLEAMVMGSFPVQSRTACADEWIEDGETGAIVPPEDPEVVEAALRRALVEDGLVDRAADRNWTLAQKRLEWRSLRQAVVASYTGIFSENSRGAETKATPDG